MIGPVFGVKAPSWSIATTRSRSEERGLPLGPGGETRRVHFIKLRP